MSEPTTDEIARWAALADAATPGPWQQATPTSAYLMCPGCEHGNYVAQAMDNRHYEHRHERLADAEFIAAARDAVPRLLALVAAQAEELHALHATDEYQRWARAVAERDAAREAVGRVRALPHEDWCCAKGCAGPGFCAGCAGTEADCRCFVKTIRDAIDGAI